MKSTTGNPTRFMGDFEKVSQYLFAGKNQFRLQAAGMIFTYKMTKIPDTEKSFWVSVERDEEWVYLGMIDQRKNCKFDVTRNSWMERESKEYKVFDLFYRGILNEELIPQIQFYHNGRCGRCYVALKENDREGLELGFGPNCRKKMDLVSVSDIVNEPLFTKVKS